MSLPAMPTPPSLLVVWPSPHLVHWHSLVSPASAVAAATVDIQPQHAIPKWGGLGLPTCCFEDLGLIETESGSAAAIGLPNGLGQMIWMDLRGGSLSDHATGCRQVFDQIMQVFDSSPSGCPGLNRPFPQRVDRAAVGVDFFLHRQVSRDALR